MAKRTKTTPRRRTSAGKTTARPKAATTRRVSAKRASGRKSGVKKPAAARTVELKPVAPAPVVGHNEGNIAPDFTLPDAYGKMHRLSDYRGKRVVLYFYPKDNTPGCTIEACDFRDKNSAINTAGAATLGVSPDNSSSHQKFIVKYNLGFTLLADVDKEVAKKYGVWKEKNNYGQTYWGIERTTFLIDEEGKIAKVFSKVQVQGHVEEVLATLKGGSASMSRAEGALGS